MSKMAKKEARLLLGANGQRLIKFYNEGNIGFSQLI